MLILCLTCGLTYALKNYCRYNHLNFRRLKEISTLLKQCIYLCSRMGFDAKYKKIIYDTNELSTTFYKLLMLTHQEYETTITLSRFGSTAVCCGLVHQIDNRAIHMMDVGNAPRQVYYSLIRTQRSNKGGIHRTINVLHGLAEHDVSENISLFSSDTEIEMEMETDDNLDEKTIVNKKNWNKFLSLLELDCVDSSNPEESSCECIN
jgi:hypothetical protein